MGIVTGFHRSQYLVECVEEDALGATPLPSIPLGQSDEVIDVDIPVLQGSVCPWMGVHAGGRQR